MVTSLITAHSSTYWAWGGGRGTVGYMGEMVFFLSSHPSPGRWAVNLQYLGDRGHLGRPCLLSLAVLLRNKRQASVLCDSASKLAFPLGIVSPRVSRFSFPYTATVESRLGFLLFLFFTVKHIIKAWKYHNVSNNQMLLKKTRNI